MILDEYVKVKNALRKVHQVIVSADVRSLGVFLAYTSCDGVLAEEGRPDVATDINELVSKLRSSYNIRTLKNHPLVRAYRDIMWRLGIDPTKVRPSSEALVRRVLRGHPFPSINSVVDSCNMASAESLVPISIFDHDLVKEPLTSRRARKGEIFVDFGGRERKLRGNEVVLSDANGNILHLYPYRDSAIAAIRTNRTNCVDIVAYGAPGVPKATVLEAVRRVCAYLLRYYPNAFCSNPSLAL